MTKLWTVVEHWIMVGHPWYAEVRQEYGSDHRYVVVSNGWHVDYPIRYDDGRIAYDFPELIPQYARPLVAKAYAWLDNN